VSLRYLVKKKQVTAEHLLRTQTTFSQSVMVSIGMSKLGVTDFGAYYRDVFLSQH